MILRTRQLHTTPSVPDPRTHVPFGVETTLSDRDMRPTLGFCRGHSRGSPGGSGTANRHSTGTFGPRKRALGGGRQVTSES